MKQISKNLTITSEQLAKDMLQKKPLLIFDLRISEKFEESHVEGSVHAVCDAQAKEKILPKIPKNTKIVLISESNQRKNRTVHLP
jgi:rhodanese-related sulfurtransferase